MQKRWFVKTPLERTTVDSFRSILKVDPVVSEILLQRGIDSFHKAEAFFRPKLTDLHDPFLMKDLESAAKRLSKALHNGERILLYGDYDVDGTTAVALMYTFLKEHSDQLDFYIPDRYTEGYGVSRKGMEYAVNEKIDLLITLDCGIKANDQIAFAREHGIDVIVCDHHTPGETLPDALVLDPKRSDDTYPYKELSGCGVGFKLLQGLCALEQWNLDKLYELLDLLAISIGADIVEITGENRILCFHGLRLLNEQPRTAFKEMLILAKRTFPVSLTDVVFTIAPRINAAGRLRSGKYAVELMISNNVDEIRQLAADIDADNTERRVLDQEITEEALELIENFEEDRSTNVVFKSDWHKGVVGIVASRIIEKHYKPTIVLTESNGEIVGSARSVKGFDVHQAIDACSDLLEQFGGHMYAAGLTLKPENLTAFSTKFEEVVRRSMEKELRTEEQIVDLELTFDQLFQPEEDRMKLPKLKRILKQLEPHGPGNMKPVFVSRNVFATDIRLLKEAHLKLNVVQPPHDVVIEAIGFNMADKIDEVAAGVPFEMVYTLEGNRWNGKETLQMNIKDLRAMV